MAAQSKIEWTDSTFNPWVGCTKIARPGGAASACDFCYAESWAKRSGQVKWGNNPRRRTTTDYWKKPLSWNAQALDFQRVHGRRQRVFCASLADVFDNQADRQWRTDLFALIRECDQLDWQLLTKRPQNIRKMLPSDWGKGYANVWLGTTTEDARAYRQRAAHLLRLPAKVHFISYEPALGPIGALKIDGSVAAAEAITFEQHDPESLARRCNRRSNARGTPADDENICLQGDWRASISRRPQHNKDHR
jgi:protein gp37